MWLLWENKLFHQQGMKPCIWLPFVVTAMFGSAHCGVTWTDCNKYPNLDESHHKGGKKNITVNHIL